jgi:hypothetical protein
MAMMMRRAVSVFALDSDIIGYSQQYMSIRCRINNTSSVTSIHPSSPGRDLSSKDSCSELSVRRG